MPLCKKILNPKQFRFQTDHSTEHTIVSLASQIYESFERNRYGHFFKCTENQVFKNSKKYLET